jgi:hypothetical protein
MAYKLTFASAGEILGRGDSNEMSMNFLSATPADKIRKKIRRLLIIHSQ